MDEEIKKEILDCFYAAMPDGLTIEDCAKGCDIEFNYMGKTHKVNTSGGSDFRIRSMESYYTLLETRVIDAVTLIPL